MVLHLPNNIVIVSKTYPSFLTFKEGSTFLSKPLFPQGRKDVAGSAIAPPEFWNRQRSLCPKGLPMIVYAIELRLFVGWRIEDISGNSTFVFVSPLSYLKVPIILLVYKLAEMIRRNPFCYGSQCSPLPLLRL